MSFLLMSFSAVLAQSLSTDVFSVGNSNLPNVGTNFNVPVNVLNMPANTRYIEVVFLFDPVVLEYVGWANLQHSGFTITTNPANGHNPAAGVLVMNYNNVATSFTAADGKLFDIIFKYLGGNSNLNFDITSPLPQCRYRIGSVITNISSATNGSITGFGYNTIDQGDWHTAANWSLNMVPTIWHQVTVGNVDEVSISANAAVYSVIVGDGGQLTLNASNTLTVTDAFTVQSGGSFIQNGTLTAGSTVAERMIATATPTGLEGWHLLSSPVMSQPIAPDFGGSVGQDFYGWDETVTNGLPWINFNGGTFSGSSFNPGTGYLVAYQSGQSGTKQFAGAFNSTDFTGIALTNSFATTNEDWNGFNLLGNPFPSAVLWNKTAWNGGAPIQASAYLWDEASADYIDLDPNGVIPAMNGFMVYTSADATIDIPLAARVHDATPWYKASEEQIITLVAHDPATGSSKSSKVRFNSQATTGYDLDFDSRLLVGYAPIFFSKAEGTNLQVNTLPELTSDVVVPFGFITNGSTDFYIQMTATIETENILLVDRKLNIVHDLTANPVYHFTSVEGDNVNRFELKFGHVGVNANPAAKSDVTVYVRDRSIYVSGNSSLAGRNIIVTNMMGQQVMKVSANDGLTVVNASNLQSGAYLVSVISENSVVTQKIVLNR